MIGPITRGARGPAVEDVQSRLLALGYDLGPTGVDGVFLGETLHAVRAFQHEHAIDEDGIVGDQTWAALVDATFQLGDRLLYLRLPHLHGADVLLLQGALNILGFACGGHDGIFGPFTERAVREFQANVGLQADGIAGLDTVRALQRLEHVWKGKDPASPAGLSPAPARAAEVLRRVRITLAVADPCGRAVAERVLNLAHAHDSDALVAVVEEPCSLAGGVLLHLTCDPERAEVAGLPVIVMPTDGSQFGRYVAAFQSSPPRREALVVVGRGIAENEHGAQALAVRILDGICAVLSQTGSPVIP